MSQSNNADSIVIAAVVATAGMGIVPVFVDVPAIVAANGAMICSLAVVYHMEWSEEQGIKVIREIIKGSFVTVVSIKALVGLVTLTGAGIPVAFTMNGVVNAMVTLGLGRAARRYFESNCTVSQSELNTIFANTVSFGGFKEVVQMLKNRRSK